MRYGLTMAVALGLVAAMSTAAGAAPTVWTWADGWMTFTKPDGADWILPENQDRLTGNVWLTRADIRGLFNINLEQAFDEVAWQSPLGTEWAFFGLNGNPWDPVEMSAANYANLIFDTFAGALELAVGDNIVGIPGVLHLIPDDIYIDIEFLDWTSGLQAPLTGGFSYQRATPEPATLALVAFGGLGALSRRHRRK